MEEEKFELFYTCIKHNTNYELSSLLLRENITSYNVKKFHQQLKDRMDRNKPDKVFSIMVTFTIDPKRHDVKDKKLHDKIEKYIVKFPRNKCCEVIRSDYVREGTDKDHKHTHWHLGLKTKKPFLNKTTKYYRNLYGHVDISRSYDNNYNNVLKYINKVIPSIKVPL